MVNWFRRRGSEAAPAVVHGTLEFSDPWVRAAPEDATQAAAFVAIANKAAAPDRLVGASTPLAETVEIHGIKVVGPDIKMKQMAEGLVVYPGDIRTLKPRGYHLLLQGVKEPLTRGSRLALTLVFEKAGPLTVEFEVREPGLIGKAILDLDHQRG